MHHLPCQVLSALSYDLTGNVDFASCYQYHNRLIFKEFIPCDAHHLSRFPVAITLDYSSLFAKQYPPLYGFITINSYYNNHNNSHK